MSFLDFFLGEKKKTAKVAKERLQIILAHERSGRSAPDYLPALQRDLVAVISKYVKINPEDIVVNLERQDNLDVLEVKIELPEKGAASPPCAAHQPQRPAPKPQQALQPQRQPQRSRH
ncbi:MAG: cell division topological specificity factor MinE [Ottowia sp.]|nr:cell division topological specificity factor MinE [Ottowia sp.]